MSKPKFSLDFEKPLRILDEQLESLRASSIQEKVDMADEIDAIERKLEATKAQIYKGLTPWQKIQLARHPQRPYSLDYIGAIFEDFQELHGDRNFRDDRAIIGGTAFFQGEPVMIIAQQKGRTTKENLMRNFGSPNPEGYRKALRLMKMAEKFNLPIISFIDTPGAYPGVQSEERHVAEAIAVNIRDMAQLQVPIIAIVIGEGGSGGALGIAVADRVLILENAYYSVISPEGCAAILWKDRAFAPQAAEALQITADKLLELGIVDGIITEPTGGAHTNKDLAAKSVKAAIQQELKTLKTMNGTQLTDKRYEKYRALGTFYESAQD